MEKELQKLKKELNINSDQIKLIDELCKEYHSLENNKNNIKYIFDNIYLIIVKINNNSKEKLIKVLSYLVYLICLKENNTISLEQKIKYSDKINEKIKIGIYLELILYCKKNNNILIKNCILDNFIRLFNAENINKFIERLIKLDKEDAYNIIGYLGDTYIIKEFEYYQMNININIQLFYSIIQYFEIREDNEYLKNNILLLEKINKDIGNKDIKFMYLNSLFLDKKDAVLKKLNLLTILPENDMEKEECYDNLMEYLKEMKTILDELLDYKAILEKKQNSPQKIYLYKINKYIEEINKGTYNTFNKLKDKMIKIIINLKKINFHKDNNKLNVINDDNDNDKINYNYNELKKEYFNLKNENKKLKEIYSKYPFILLKNEYILSLIIISKDEKVITSLLCKNTDEFSKVESRFYQEYPEYLPNKVYFKFNNNLIDKNKTLEEIKLKNNSIIIFENSLGEDKNKEKNDICDNIENNIEEKSKKKEDYNSDDLDSFLSHSNGDDDDYGYDEDDYRY